MLSDDINCPIHLGELKEPKVLQCKHVFCRECLDQWLSKQVDEYQLPCPIDRTLTVLGESGVTGLPEPLIVRSVSESITRFVTGNEDADYLQKPCDLCTDRTLPRKLAVNFCRYCAKNFCDTCSEKHAKRFTSKAHQLVYFSKRTMCETHRGELYMAYCKTCGVGVCVHCVDGEHVQHDIIEFIEESLVDESRDKLKSFRENASQQTRDMNQHRVEIKDAKQKMTEDRKDFQTWRGDLKTRLDEILHSSEMIIDEQVAGELKWLGMYAESIGELTACRENMLSYIDGLLVRGVPHDLVMAAEELPPHSNSVPVLAKLKYPGKKDRIQLLQSVQEFVEREMDLINLPTESDDTMDVIREGWYSEEHTVIRRPSGGSNHSSRTASTSSLGTDPRRRAVVFDTSLLSGSLEGLRSSTGSNN